MCSRQARLTTAGLEEDSLATVVIVGEKKGEEFQCGIEVIAGSSVCDDYAEMVRKMGAGASGGEDAAAAMLEVAKKVAMHPYTLEDTPSEIRQRYVEERFTPGGFPETRKAASNARLKFVSPQVSFEMMVKVLQMSNVHYRDMDHKVSEMGMEKVSELVDVFGWLGFNPEAKVGLTMKGGEGKERTVWISKQLMFAINLAKALSAGGGGVMSDVRKVAGGERGVEEAVKKLREKLGVIPFLGEYLKTIRIETLEALESQDPANLPFKVEKSYGADEKLTIRAVSERLSRGECQDHLLYYLHKVNKAGTFRVAALRLNMASYQLSDEQVLSSIEKTLAMFPRVERVDFVSVFPRSLGCESRFGASKPKTLAEEAFDLVLDQIEKNVGIEGLLLEQYDMLNEERIARIQKLRLRVFGLGYRKKTFKDIGDKVPKLLEPGTVLASSIDTLSVSYYILHKEHRKIREMESLRTVEVQELQRVEDMEELKGIAIDGAEAREIESLVVLGWYWEPLLRSMDIPMVENIFKIVRPRRAAMESISPLFLALLEKGKIENVEGLREVSVEVELDQDTARERAKGKAIRTLLDRGLERVEITVRIARYNLQRDSEGGEERTKEGKRVLEPGFEKLCLDLIKDVCEVLAKKKGGAIRVALVKYDRGVEDFGIPPENAVRYLATEEREGRGMDGEGMRELMKRAEECVRATQ